MKNLFLVLICFAFAGISLQAQTDSSIPKDAIGTYQLFGTDATAIVSSTAITATTGSSSLTDGSGGSALGGAETKEDSSTSDSGSSAGVGLHDVRKTSQGWGGIYTTEDGKDIPVMVEIVKDSRGRYGITAKDRSGTVWARYIKA